MQFAVMNKRSVKGDNTYYILSSSNRETRKYLTYVLSYLFQIYLKSVSSTVRKYDCKYLKH